MLSAPISKAKAKIKSVSIFWTPFDSNNTVCNTLSRLCVDNYGILLSESPTSRWLLYCKCISYRLFCKFPNGLTLLLSCAALLLWKIFVSCCPNSLISPPSTLLAIIRAQMATYLQHQYVTIVSAVTGFKKCVTFKHPSTPFIFPLLSTHSTLEKL